MALKRILLITMTGGTLLFTSGCADDNLAKGLVTVAGAGAGSYIGAQLAGPGNHVMGGVIGAVAGGGLGYLLGGAIGKK